MKILSIIFRNFTELPCKVNLNSFLYLQKKRATTYIFIGLPYSLVNFHFAFQAFIPVFRCYLFPAVLCNGLQEAGREGKYQKSSSAFVG